MNDKKVRKAVIAAAGFGTRFLPQTKAMPKEMLPVVDKPIIQYIVEQLVEAGIEDIVIVTGYHKRSIEDHFDQMSAELRINLKSGGKIDLLEDTKKISDLANFAYVRQKGPYGSATPIENVQHLIGDEPFIYTFADDIITASPNRFIQMIEHYEKYNTTILPCISLTEDSQFDRYGVIDGSPVNDEVMRINALVEKPGKLHSPSDFGSVGGYLLTPEVFKYLEPGRNRMSGDDEFYLTTYVLEPMIEDGHEMFAALLKDSKYYDTGNKLEYLKTVVDFALDRPDIKDDFIKYLKTKV